MADLFRIQWDRVRIKSFDPHPQIISNAGMWQFPEIFLCADDYALHEGVSQGICELLEKGRLSGTSAMVNMPRWVQDAPLLKPYAARGAQVGLHLNLTEGAPLTFAPSLAPDGQFRPLNDQLKAVLKGLLKPNDIVAEIRAQLQAFVDVWGAMPDFIDGHQHMHAVPIIRMELFTVLDEFVERYSIENGLPPCFNPAKLRKRSMGGGAVTLSVTEGGVSQIQDTEDARRNPSPSPHPQGEGRSLNLYYNITPWIRIPTDTHTSIFSRPEIVKAEFVRLFAGGMAAQADVHGVPYNIGFSGFSAFDYATPEQYRSLFRKCLQNLGPRPLIMCHPSAPCDVEDAILPARMAEFGYLKSGQFSEDLDSLTLSLHYTSAQHIPS